MAESYNFLQRAIRPGYWFGNDPTTQINEVPTIESGEPDYTGSQTAVDATGEKDPYSWSDINPGFNLEHKWMGPASPGHYEEFGTRIKPLSDEPLGPDKAKFGDRGWLKDRTGSGFFGLLGGAMGGVADSFSEEGGYQFPGAYQHGDFYDSEDYY